MSAISSGERHTLPPPVPPLYAGDRLTQAEFHRRYEAFPAELKAELIGGIVIMPSPFGRRHAAQYPHLSGVFWLYGAATPGVEVLDNATTILGRREEPQPDLALWIQPEYGGQARENEREYIEGAPELVAEIAHSTEAIDLHAKRDDYQRAGVREYLVVCLAEQELRWFDFEKGRDLRPNRQGIWKSRVFPGLWIDGQALLARDASRLMEVVRQGVASREHAAFIKRLAAARRKRS